MSLARMAYYSSVISGWCAFIGWMICEASFLHRQNLTTWDVILATGIIGGAIGAGLNVVAGMSNGSILQSLLRIGPGLIGGGIGGAVGGFFGNLCFAYLGMPRVIGWIVMGLGIGVIEGLYERSPSKIRNGLLGGGLGGLAGGLLFDILPQLIHSNSAMYSRATGFVILGLCIGAFIGLAHVVLREAWLTVVDGYRVGRQLILSSPVTILGRGDHLPLPFIGSANIDLDSEHLSIERINSGGYVLKDRSTKLGTYLNGVRVQDTVELHDGDMIKLGGNFVRFNSRQKLSRGAADPGGKVPQLFQPSTPSAPPPPPAIRNSLPPVRAASTPAQVASAPPVVSSPPIANPAATNKVPSIPAPPQAPRQLPLPPPKVPLAPPKLPTTPSTTSSTNTVPANTVPPNTVPQPVPQKPKGMSLPPPPPKKTP